MNDNLFEASATQDQGPDALLEQLKTKFTKEDGTVDVDALLKKTAHQEMHIGTLEPENANLRKKVDESLTYQDLLDKINAQRQTASSEVNHTPERVENPKEITEESIQQLVEKTLTKKQQESIQASNIAYVAQELTKVWGDNYVPLLRSKAKELHLSEVALNELAKNNPQALLAIVNPKANEADTTFVPPRSRTNNTNSGTPSKNWKYYQQMSKTDPKRFNSPEMVKERYDQAMALKEDFYN